MLYRLVISPQQIQDDRINLDQSQEHYLKNVVRLNDRDFFIALDGKGTCWRSQLTSNGAKIIEVLSENKELSIAVTLIVALPKGSGFEDIIRCTTELGVACLQPVISKRTLLKPNANKLKRWQKIAQEASEQSERQIVPEIKTPISAKEAFEVASKLQVPKYIAFARATTPHLQHFLNEDLYPFPTEIVLATGCEGGWTKNEIQQAVTAGFQEVSLGKRILRAVTAPIMMMSTIASFLECNYLD